MISLTALSERFGYAARAIDDVLRAAPLERLEADHEPPDEKGIRKPKMFRFLWKFMGEEQEPIEVALSTTRHKGGLVCERLVLELESDVKVESRDGRLFLTLKKSRLGRLSRMRVNAEFVRNDDDPEGLELSHEKHLATLTPEEKTDGEK